MTTKTKLATVVSIAVVAACAAWAYTHFVYSAKPVHDSIKIELIQLNDTQQQPE